MARGLTLDHLSFRLGVCRLAANTPVPDWAWQAQDFLTISRTPEELSITADEAVIPEGIPSQRGFCAFRVRGGTMGFGLVGLLASVLQPLAEGGVSVFSISTHDTDYILVRRDEADRTVHLLEGAGHHVVSAGPPGR